MKKRVAPLMAVVLTSLAIGLFAGCGKGGEAPSKKAAETASTHEAVVYTCPMHPSVISDKPGACPVCGMALVRKTAAPPAEDTGHEGSSHLATVSLSPTQRVTANVSTVRAERGNVSRDIAAVGVVDVAEPLRVKVTARFPGRIEKLHAAVTGEVVKKGQPLYEVHSPELYAAERELILAVKAMKAPGASADRERLLMLEATMDRLHLHFGMTHEQISALADSGRAKDTVMVLAPIGGTVVAKLIQEGQYVEEGSVLYDIADLSRVWIGLDVYERDLRFVTKGSRVSIRTDAWPGETFSGTVTFVEPVVDPATRTVRVRTEFDNPAGKLKPQMYVEAKIHGPSSGGLMVPASAVMSTGERTIVWVEVAENQFEPREVRVGSSGNGMVEVVGGLEEGEKVVSSGGYLLDSESQLRSPSGAGHGSEPR